MQAGQFQQGRQPIQCHRAAAIGRRVGEPVCAGIPGPNQADPRTLVFQRGEAGPPGLNLGGIGVQIRDTVGNRS